MKMADCHPDRKHKALGLCASCYGSKWAKESGFYKTETYKKYRHEAFDRRHKKILAERKRWAQKNPKKIHEYGIKGREKYPDRDRNQAKRYRAKLKFLILQYYGGSPPRCACCGEANFEFLAIDHINGGGTAHVKELKRQGSTFYGWILREKFPDGFRVLCHNCNFAIGVYGYCPHEKFHYQGVGENVAKQKVC